MVTGIVMGEWTFVDGPWFSLLVLPVLIFCARIVDVSLDTMRILYMNRGRKVIAPLLGFVQALIWILAVSQVMKNLANPICYLAYGAGFATGNYVGMRIEEKVATGLLTLRIITPSDLSPLVAALRQAGHGVTILTGRGSSNTPVNVAFIVLRRRHMPTVERIIREHAPTAFYSTEEVRATTGGTLAAHGLSWRPRSPFRRGGRA
ncbi:MAG: DUF2179 domain-containing protein [Lentisphaerae bacterium]|nr:DUF2179 domain-containing protein [Lentisphaerota bacterium]